MRKLLFIFAFVFLLCSPVYASSSISDLSFNFAVKKNTGYSYSYSMDNFVNLSDTVPDDDVKIYGFRNTNTDSSLGGVGSSFIIVSNVPFSFDLSMTLGASSQSDNFVCDSTSKWYYNEYVDGTHPSAFTLKSACCVSGYYGFTIGFDSPYYEFISSNGFYDIIDQYYNYRSELSPDLKAFISDYFFQLPPTLNPPQQEVTEMETVGEVILGFLVSGVGLVILLIVFLVLVTLLVRYLRRSLSL